MHMKRAAWLLACGLGVLAWSSGPGLAGGKKGIEVTVDGMKSRVPASWREDKVPEKLRKFRVKQFVVPHADGDETDAVVFISYLGGQGGSVRENIGRWQALFRPPEGKSI